VYDTYLLITDKYTVIKENLLCWWAFL